MQKSILKIFKISAPLIISELFYVIYELADGAWVSGLGTRYLSAIGSFFPVYMALFSIPFGVSIGVSSLISRKIGEKSKEGVENSAINAIILAFIISVALTLFSYYNLPEILILIGDDANYDLIYSYAEVIVLGIPVIVFGIIGFGIIMGKADTKKILFVNAFGSVLNIILDPIFIYALGLGLKGAAMATIFSMTISSFLAYYLILQKLHFDLSLRKFRFDSKIILDILMVGIPATLSFIVFSVTILAINKIILQIGYENGIAVYIGSLWLIEMGLLPAYGIAGAIVPLVGKCYGEGNFSELKSYYLSGIKLSLLLVFPLLVGYLVFTPQVALIYTYSEASREIYYDLVMSIRILTFIIPLISVTLISISAFEGMGKGGKAFFVDLICLFFLPVLFSFMLSKKAGFFGVLVGGVVGLAIGALFALLYTLRHITSKATTQLVGIFP